MEKSLIPNNLVILNKTNINEIVKELTSCVLTYDYLCLSRTQKWCSEMLYAIEEASPLNEYDSIKNECFNMIDPKEFRRFQLARSCFNSREFLRASFYLKDCESPAGFFLNVYAKYMAIMKKCADNKSDLFNNMDSSNFDSLQSLRNELSTKYNKNQLDAYSLYLYGIVLSKLKLVDEAILIFIDSIKKRPTLWCAWLELASLIKSLEALQNLNHSSLPQHWMKDLFMAHCYMELSLSEDAVNIYTVYCNKGFNKSVYVKSQIAKCYDNLREGQEAKQIFEFIRKLDPYSLDFMDIYSNILFVLEEHAQLAILAQEVCEIDKYKPESCCIIGNYYSLQNEHHKAVNYFQRALKLNQSYLQAWTLMGHEFMELKNSTSAIQSYTNAIELNPKDYRAWYGLGQTYEILKLYSYSLYYYKQAHVLRPTDSRFIVALADVYVKLEKWDEAKRCYIKAYSVGDYEGAALCKLAKVYDKLNEPINVAIAYDQFTEDQKLHRRSSANQVSELSQAYKYLANFYLKKMKLDNAYEAATKCLEFAETRQEAQSILNQIVQTRNNLKEHELNPLNDSVNTGASGNNSSKIEMEGVVSENNLMGSSNPVSSKAQETDEFNEKSKIGIDDGGSSKETNSGTNQQETTNQDSDSESDTFFSDFNIKRFSTKNDHK